MNPQLALFLCISFVLFLLWLDRKQTSNVSIVLWIPTIWMLLISSKPLAIWLGPTEGMTMESGSPLDRMFLLGLLFLGLLILVYRNLRWFHAIKKDIWLILIIGYMLVSIFWSDMAFISFKRWIRELVAVVMAFIVATELSPKESIQSLLRRTIYILIPFSLLLIKYFGEYGRQYNHWDGQLMWIGVTLQKNGLGRLCLISTFFLIWMIIRRWQRVGISACKIQTLVDIFILLIALYLLKGPGNSYSATAIGTTIIGVVAFVALLRMVTRQKYFAANLFVPIVALVISIGVITPFVGGSTVSGVASFLGRDVTLTGRTVVWPGLLLKAGEKQILGHGIGGFWSTENKETHYDSDAHNGYLDVLLTQGFLGVLLLSIFLLSCCRKAQQALTYDFDTASLCICILLMVVVHNITESSIHTFSSQLTATLLFLKVSLPNLSRH